MKSGGFNPMRWDCEKNGCFNKKCRPKIEVFSSCFPGKINFGDVDGLVELKGKFCLLEWKGNGGNLSMGQKITYKNFTLIPGNVVFVVNGNAESMVVKNYCIFWNGKQHDWISADIDVLKSRITAWAKNVDPERCQNLPF